MIRIGPPKNPAENPSRSFKFWTLGMDITMTLDSPGVFCWLRISTTKAIYPHVCTNHHPFKKKWVFDVFDLGVQKLPQLFSEKSLTVIKYTWHGTHTWIFGKNPCPTWQLSSDQNPKMTFHYTAWIKGILMAYYSPYMCQGLNSHYIHIIGDKLINPLVGVYRDPL